MALIPMELTKPHDLFMEQIHQAWLMMDVGGTDHAANEEETNASPDQASDYYVESQDGRGKTFSLAR
jgi:hypothetical protein